MEPLDEQELSHLLRKWEAPAAPANLRRRVLPERESRWKWLVMGTIRIPVPVGFAAVVVVVLWLLYYPGKAPVVIAPAPKPPAAVSLADFQPVQQLEPQIVGERK